MSNEGRLTPEAQAALDAVRQRIGYAKSTDPLHNGVPMSFEGAVLAALENLEARVAKLEQLIGSLT